MNTQAEMQFVGEIDGKKVYWAEPGKFSKPGIYFWDGQQNIHVPMDDTPSRMLSDKALIAAWRVRASHKDEVEAAAIHGCADELESRDEVFNGTPTLGELSVTSRGFSIINFEDRNGVKCSLQTSSACDFSHCTDGDDDCMSRPMLWLGVHDVVPKIMAFDAIKLGYDTNGQTAGWVDIKLPNEVLLSSRMHLTVPKVEALIADLHRWLKAEYY